MVLSTGNGLHIFTLEPYKKQFHRVADHVKVPADGKCYSINEVNFDDFAPALKDFVQYCRNKKQENGKRKYTGRYIGSLCADFHRNLIKGGIYIYPATGEAPNGKLRLVYEGNPMTYLMAQAGGYGTDGADAPFGGRQRAGQPGQDAGGRGGITARLAEREQIGRCAC